MTRLPGVVAFCLFVVASMLASAPLSNAQPANSDSITSESVKPHVVWLSDDKLEGRGGGYPGERKAADYIAKQFKRIGLKPVGGSRSYFQEFQFHPYHPVKPWEMMTSRNVLGYIEGADPQLRNEVVVIGAHYDGQGRTGQADPTREPATDSDQIWNSANDNATSIAAILEIARAIKAQRLQPKRSILFIAFGAEEHGMDGSIYYVTHPAFDLNRHVAMINLEKLGRSPEKPLSINGAASSPAWAKILSAANEQTKAKISINPYAFPDSDHYPFGASKIPAVLLYVSTGVDGHKASDSADKIDFARNAEAARLALAILLETANQPARAAYVPSPIPDMGMIAHLMTNAEADAVGLSGNASGLKVTGVLPNLSAAMAGVQTGDVVLKVGDREFHRDDTLVALMTMYRQMLEGKLGFRFPMTVLRQGKRLEMTMTLR